MKHIFIVLPLLLLIGCTRPNSNHIINTFRVDCQKGISHFQKYIEQDLLKNEENMWVVDLELFYNQELQTCIGKYVAYRKEGNKDDITVFNIRNIRKNEDIYYARYSGDSLVREWE